MGRKLNEQQLQAALASHRHLDVGGRRGNLHKLQWSLAVQCDKQINLPLAHDLPLAHEKTLFKS